MKGVNFSRARAGGGISEKTAWVKACRRLSSGGVCLFSKPLLLPFPLGDHVFDEVADGEGALIIHRFGGHAL